MVAMLVGDTPLLFQLLHVGAHEPQLSPEQRLWEQLVHDACGLVLQHIMPTLKDSHCMHHQNCMQRWHFQ